MTRTSEIRMTVSKNELHQLALAASGAVEEAQRYLAGARTDWRPRASDTCCPAHTARFERDASIHAALEEKRTHAMELLDRVQSAKKDKVPYATSSYIIELTSRQLWALLGALIDDQLELRTSTAWMRTSWTPTKEDTCCEEHYEQFENNRARAHDLKKEKKRIALLVKKLEYALAQQNEKAIS